MRHVLVTGGAGYIGTHTVVALVSAGARVTVVDSLVNAHGAALDRARALVDHPERIAFVHVSGRGRCSRGRSALRRAVRAPHIPLMVRLLSISSSPFRRRTCATRPPWRRCLRARRPSAHLTP
jgi:NAD(P)-dependent dehydrogenase (short-subunit alcohol dehydrogenase family)